MPIELRSYSKINLGLAIGPSRPDGYHALTTMYQTLALHDLVQVEARPAAQTHIELTTNHHLVPCNPKNTAWRMIELALAEMGIAAEVYVHIEKRLPVQGGLGAGSANAAAALLGLEHELGLSIPGATRLRLAARIGSDVPLFLIGGAVLGLGRGEEVYPLPELPATPCVVAIPEIGVSTPEAFRQWDARAAPSRQIDPLTTSAPADRLDKLSRSIAAAWSEPHSSGVFPPHGSQGDVDGRKDLAETPLLALVHTGIANDFEEVVFLQHPRLREIKCVLAGSDQSDEGALYAALSGSGAALFGLYSSPEAAGEAVRRLQAQGVQAYETLTLPRAAYWRSMVFEGESR